MPRTCSVLGCKTGYRNQEHHTTFRFPKDPERRLQWLKSVRRFRNFQVTSHSAVCILHFPEKYIIRERKGFWRVDSELKGRDRPKLTNDAVPEIFPVSMFSPGNFPVAKAITKHQKQILSQQDLPMAEERDDFLEAPLSESSVSGLILGQYDKEYSVETTPIKEINPDRNFQTIYDCDVITEESTVSEEKPETCNQNEGNTENIMNPDVMCISSSETCRAMDQSVVANVDKQFEANGIKNFDDFVQNYSSRNLSLFESRVFLDFVLFYKISASMCNVPEIPCSVKVFCNLRVQAYLGSALLPASEFKGILTSNLQCNNWDRFERLLSHLNHLFIENFVKSDL